MPHTSLSAARAWAMGLATCPVGPVIRIFVPRICRSYARPHPPSAFTPAEISATVEQESTPISLLFTYHETHQLGAQCYVICPRYRSQSRNRPRDRDRVCPPWSSRDRYRA